MPPRPLRLLAISGSLRRASSNTSMLRAMAALAPADITVALYEGLDTLPPFNPDDDGDPPFPAVAAYRDELLKADGVLISTPEYAHGMPGALKNALDWVVGSGELVNKPIALINPSPRSTFAQASLMEVLWKMSGNLIEDAFVTVQMTGRVLPEGGIAADPEIAAQLRGSMTALARAIRAANA